MPKPTFRMVKLQYMHAALQIILKPLVELGLFGKVSLGPRKRNCVGSSKKLTCTMTSARVILASCMQKMLDPSGTPRNVFPRLLTVIADMKEKWELVCLYGSSARVNRPCPACTDTRGAMERKLEKIVGGTPCVPSRWVACLCLFAIYYLWACLCVCV